MNFQRTAVLGAGTIGMSWAALFAATGREVAVFDPAPESPERVLALIDNAAEALNALGFKCAGDTGNIRFTKDASEAVDGADFIQENVPELLEVKHQLFARIEPTLKERAIIGSSTSGLRLSEMQEGFSDPGRFILAHPFNPPHLIPLVELMDNERTEPGVLETAQLFYQSMGKVCVRLRKEVSGHIANRLQAALWREAIHLAIEGVASVEDIDKTVAFGPGLRWAAMGPNTLLHLGGGPGGIRAFCEHLGGPFQNWWDDLGAPRLTPEVVDTLATGVDDMMSERSERDIAAERDRLILSFLQAKAQKS